MTSAEAITYLGSERRPRCVARHPGVNRGLDTNRERARTDPEPIDFVGAATNLPRALRDQVAPEVWLPVSSEKCPARPKSIRGASATDFWETSTQSLTVHSQNARLRTRFRRAWAKPVLRWAMFKSARDGRDGRSRKRLPCTPAISRPWPALGPKNM
jgi:hypothetical protein